MIHATVHIDPAVFECLKNMNGFRCTHHFSQESDIQLIKPKLTRRQEALRWFWRQYTADLPYTPFVEKGVVQP